MGAQDKARTGDTSCRVTTTIHNLQRLPLVSLLRGTHTVHHVKVGVSAQRLKPHCWSEDAQTPFLERVLKPHCWSESAQTPLLERECSAPLLERGCSNPIAGASAQRLLLEREFKGT